MTLTQAHLDNMVDNSIDSEANRYCDIIPYKSTVVQVSGDSDKEKYINANYIYTTFPYRSSNYYIATQGPLNQTFDNFWKMIWEHESRVIIMLCKLKEVNRPKCDQYWPIGKQKYGQITVENLGEKNGKDKEITIRMFKLTKEGQNNELQVEQIHWEGWPDHGVPENTQALQELAVKAAQDFQNNLKPTLHCSAGVGRTGTLLSCTFSYIELKKIYENIKNDAQIHKEQKQEEFLKQQLNMFDIVRKLREQRTLMVQTKEQFKMVQGYFM
ncbi:protein-tyrosine phosphatase protein, putative, partial [Ichthyophthirius multifiliis]